MKKIPLRGKYGKGKFALVDDEDFNYLNQFKWFAKKPFYGKQYAVRNLYIYVSKNKYKGSVIRMHREIMKATTGIEVDHKDGNGLNNRGTLKPCLVLPWRPW